MEIKQTKIENGTAFLEAIVPSQAVDEEKNHCVDEMIKSVRVKGFREGKAPKSIAEKHLDPDKLTNHIVNHTISHILEHAVEEHKYRLIGRPVLEDLKTEKDGSWLIKLQLPVYPETKLGDYKKYLKSKDKNKKAEDIYELLLKNEKVDISPLIVNEEVAYSLERLANQAKSLNLPLEDYLKALKKTLADVKKEYAESAEKSLKLDIILQEIAKNEKITVEDKELLELAKVGSLGRNQLEQLRSVLIRRKAIDFLMTI